MHPAALFPLHCIPKDSAGGINSPLPEQTALLPLFLSAPAGISLKTQELYLVVFIARYLDLFTNFHSLYNSVMKVFYLAGGCMERKRPRDERGGARAAEEGESHS